MLHAFVHLDPALLNACSDSVVLTPNERLRRELLRGYAAHRQAAGNEAWPTARVFSLNTFLEQRYLLAREQSPRLPALLSTEDESLLWQRVIPAEVRELAKMAREAWQLAIGWGIEFDESNFSQTDNARNFLAWVREVRRELEKTSSITRAELPDMLSTIDESVPPALTCIEFETVAPSQLRYLDRLETLGCQIERRNVKTLGPAPSRRVELDTQTEEINACAQWCRTILESGTDHQIGVVIPNLGDRYHAIARQFGAVLNPNGVSDLYDLGGGTHLAEQPIWVSAHGWLRFCFERLEHNAVSRLFTSPYLDLPEIKDFPATLPDQYSVHALAVELGQNTDDARFLAITNHIRETRAAHPLADWVRHFLHVLDLGGWGATHAGSAQFQAHEHLINLLERLACQPADTPKCSAMEALECLQHTLSEQIFAPERAQAPIQVMGYLETTGLRFSHLWVCGMVESSWPMAPSANPLIPHSVQRAAQLPRIDHESELNFARARIHHWEQSSKRLIFSHATHDGETIQLPSVLTSHIPLTLLTRLIKKHRAPTHPYFERKSVQLETVEGFSGSEVPAGKIRGGSSLLRDQAGCPFRAWAIHRLGVKETRLPHAFPDALDRGILVHEALHRLLKDVPDQSSIQRLDVQNLRSIARLTVAALYRRFPASYREREIDRLTAILQAWITFEKDRAPFQIDSLETDTTLELAGIELSLRIDRIDRIDDKLVVIDYKTGQVRSSRLTGTPLLEPQLPAYAIATEEVAAICFARVNDSGVGLSGIAATDLNLQPARLRKLPAGGWQEVRATWERQLNEILGEFKQGYAAVTPRDQALCQTCHLASFCRIQSGTDSM